MIVYFDTSAIVPIVIDEPASAVAAQLWDEADRVVSSRLVYPEARAALAMARRLGRIDHVSLGRATRAFERLFNQLDLVELVDSLAREAGRLAEQLGLRGYDAVHLASARLIADAETVVATGDRRLLAAARSVGLLTAALAN